MSLEIKAREIKKANLKITRFHFGNLVIFLFIGAYYEKLTRIMGKSS
ncbi:hypothetical protein GA0061094_3141 [[Bacillus] enclensis]|uniref:Uncharacterized protein n=1 Tax=[Bacillus] enclensis TaxID=1402860 RepID=A0A1C4CQY2_9BACI|nr:hypothetical protein GA0061094_3141 [[Bacillus] enclensis]